MNLKLRNTLIAGFAILCILGILVLSLYSGKIPMNPKGTIGNTAGNLYNGGYFCEHNSMVYFSNPKDNGCLYSMAPNGQDLTKLSNAPVRNILAGGDYLYFFQSKASGNGGLGYVRSSHGFYRYHIPRKDFTALTTDVVVNAQLVNNYLYLLTAGNPTPSFYKMKIDKSDKTVLSQQSINPSCAEGDFLYYNGTENNHYLYSLNTNTDVETEVWAGNIWYPIVYGDYVYYLDVANNYRLCRYIRSENIVEVLTDDRVDCFNIGGGYIYYQCNSKKSPRLMMMSANGSDKAVIAEGNYTNISITSQYVYFQEYGREASLFRAPIGSVNYSSM